MIDSGPPDGTGSVSKVGAERIVNGKEKKRMKMESICVDIFTDELLKMIQMYNDLLC